MSESLRDQLLKAGLVTKKQATQVEQTQQRQQYRQAKGQKPAQTDEQRRALEQARAAKVARDRELNQQRAAKADAKARHAEIRQLIDQHRLPPLEGEQFDYFNFVAGKKIRRIALNPELRARLARGELCIVRHEGRSALVPGDVAARIGERDERVVIAFSDAPAAVDDDDPYKDFVVPDDLRW
jgi:uncharacterized protein YaiL (DUF2058 family)